MESAQQAVGMQHRTFYPSHSQKHQLVTGFPVLAKQVPRAPLTPPTISYRTVLPSDLEILREIHEALFPIKYEMEFFLSVVHGKGIVAWVAVDTSRQRHGDEVVGFITARITKATEADGSDILGCDVTTTDQTLLYILTLGVVKPYRNFGIASALVWQVVEYASRIPTCRAVYLHVIDYNKSAILFYQKNSFRCLRRLYNFYHINGSYHDAFLYIYYVNGGRSPCSALDFLSAAGAFLKNVFTSIFAKLYTQNEDRARPKLMGP